MAELAGSSEPTAENSSSVNGLSSVLAAAIMRRINLPKFISASGNASSIKIDEIRLGEASVDRVEIEDVKTELDTGMVTIENARAIVSLRISFNYGLHINLPWPIPDINIDDSISIGTIRFPFDIGDITIPALENVDLVIPSALLEDIQASLEPVNNLDLGGGSFTGIKLDDTVLPSAGFALGGLSLGALNLNDVNVPSVSAARLSVDGFSPDKPLLLPSISIKNIELPSTSAPQVKSEAPVVVPDVSSESRNIPLISRGPLRASIDIDPTLTFAISSMVINDISAISTIEKIDLKDTQSTAQISGVAVDGLDLNSVELESVTIEG